MVMIDFESIKIGDDAGAGVNEKLFRLFSGLKQELIEEFDPPARKWSLWRDKPALLTCFLYAAIGFAFIIFWEVLPCTLLDCVTNAYYVSMDDCTCFRWWLRF